MATNKTGFIYYNIDTDRYQDMRIKRLKKRLKSDGLVVYDYLLCEIYRVKGCFLDWNNDLAFDIAEYFSIDEQDVINIVNYCCEIGLFSEATLKKHNVLTSFSIQKRFKEMCVRAKRKDAIIPKQYVILPEESIIIPEESIIIPEKNDRVKYSIVNKSTPIIPIGDPPDFDAIDFNALGANFNTKLGQILPKVTLPMSQARKTAVRARIKEHGKDGVKEMLNIVLNCPMLLGYNDRGWLASFDWLFKSANFTKVIEGNYLKNERNGNTTAVGNSPDTSVRKGAYRDDAQGRRASVENLKNLAIAILSSDAP